MSRVHDALRKAEELPDKPAAASLPATALNHDALNGAGAAEPDSLTLVVPAVEDVAEPPITIGVASLRGGSNGLARIETKELQVDWRDFLARCRTVPFHPAPEAHLIDVDRPHEVPGEEFRSLRTRLNHMQSLQDLHAIVVTSASPAEGKTFTALNLALAQAQLESPVLIVDLDLRRPVIHNMFQCERSPGFSDFVLAEKPLEDCIRRIEGSNLYFMPAGTQVKNPLELLNMRQVKYTFDAFRKVFNWVILDTPPLLFSADANLLATITDGTLIVVRIGSTTYDNVIRAMQSLCENNVLGIVANGARASELYSKYTYYYTKTETDEEE
jgi:protein-tyrosine kinase